jgi:hypothetical protein
LECNNKTDTKKEIKLNSYFRKDNRIVWTNERIFKVHTGFVDEKLYYNQSDIEYQ